MVENKASLKRLNEADNPHPAKKTKENNYDIPTLLQEQADDTLEAKEKQIQKLKEALQNAHDDITSWTDACPDYDPITIKTELSSMKTFKAQLQEARKRDRSLVMRLSTKEQEIHDLQMQVNDFRQALSPHTRQLVGTLFDPAVNMYIQKLKDEIKQLEKKLKQANDDVEAQKFTPHSTAGRKLMAKCRSLQEENEELGKQIAEGRLHKLSQETSLQREYAEELKASLAEANEFVLQLDQEVEALQLTIFELQRQLKVYKSREANLQAPSSLEHTKHSASPIHHGDERGEENSESGGQTITGENVGGEDQKMDIGSGENEGVPTVS